jgi:transcriptional regulator with XRE-family HTH domain
MQFFISPSRLKALREQNKLTVTALGGRLKNLKKPVATKTISNIEKDKHEKRSLRKYTLDNLAAGLGVRPEVLSGEEPLPAKNAPSDRVELNIDSQTRLNYDLIERRYNVSIEDVVNIAPVLFMKAAKESLARQKRLLEEEVLRRISTNPPMPGETPPQSLATVSEWHFESIDNDGECFGSRAAAIEGNDLFEATVPYHNFGIPGEDPNPFAYYLQDVCASEIGHNLACLEDEPYFSVHSYFSGDQIPINSVCNEDLNKITLGSNEAALALRTGIVRIKVSVVI